MPNPLFSPFSPQVSSNAFSSPAASNTNLNVNNSDFGFGGIISLDELDIDEPKTVKFPQSSPINWNTPSFGTLKGDDTLNNPNSNSNYPSIPNFSSPFSPLTMKELPPSQPSQTSFSNSNTGTTKSDNSSSTTNSSLPRPPPAPNPLAKLTPGSSSSNNLLSTPPIRNRSNTVANGNGTTSNSAVPSQAPLRSNNQAIGRSRSAQDVNPDREKSPFGLNNHSGSANGLGISLSGSSSAGGSSSSLSKLMGLKISTSTPTRSSSHNPSTSDLDIASSPVSVFPNPVPMTSNTSGFPFPSVGPVVRPLDYLALSTQEGTLAELEKTVASLASWLGVVDDGLGRMLQ
jgi:hypothetical protein